MFGCITSLEDYFYVLRHYRPINSSLLHTLNIKIILLIQRRLSPWLPFMGTHSVVYITFSRHSVASSAVWAHYEKRWKWTSPWITVRSPSPPGPSETLTPRAQIMSLQTLSSLLPLSLPTHKDHQRLPLWQRKIKRRACGHLIILVSRFYTV